MKNYLKEIFLNLVSLYLLSLILNKGIIFSNGWETLALTALALTFLNKAIKPIIKLLFLPLNLLTLGMFRWVTNVIILFLLAWLVPNLQIKSFHFPGFSYQGISISEMEIGFFWVLILASFILSLIKSFLFWFIE